MTVTTLDHTAITCNQPASSITTGIMLKPSGKCPKGLYLCS